MEGSAKRSNAALLPRGQRPHSTRLSAAGLFAHRFARLVGGERERPEVGVPRLLNLDDVARGGLGVVVWYELAGVGPRVDRLHELTEGNPNPVSGPGTRRAVAQRYMEALSEEYRRRGRTQVRGMDNRWWLVAFRDPNVPC